MPLNSNTRRVVITGFGMITPLGKNSEDTFEKAQQGFSGIREIKSFNTQGFSCRIGGEIDNRWLAESTNITAQKLHKFTSRGARLIETATREAYAQARLHEIEDRNTIGISIGSHGDNPDLKDIQFLHKFYDGRGHWNLKELVQTGGYSYFNFYRRKPDIITSFLAALFNCRGQTYSIASACAAGAQAIGEAFHLIREGRSDVMIAGGGEATLDFFGLVGFTLLRALSDRYSSPQKASRPFDRKRNGFVLSEGAGIVVLEEFEHALSRKSKILGEILGYGSSSDAYRITDMHPEGTGAILAMRGALEDASLPPDKIDYINAHGTSTIQNDMTETLAIKEIFREKSAHIPVSSNKSMLGHTIAGAGAIECVLTLLGMNRSILLPTINYEHPDPKCDLDYVPNESRQIEHRCVLSNSFGFGGQNACLCLGKYEH
jgi:3-oxoacyl-[acyl-carrier-protein] synthase II